MNPDGLVTKVLEMQPGDGWVNEQELVSTSGLAPSQILIAIRRLVHGGTVESRVGEDGEEWRMYYPERRSDAQIVFGLLVERVAQSMLTVLSEHDKVYAEGGYDPDRDPLKVGTERQLSFAKLGSAALLQGVSEEDCRRIAKKTQDLWEWVWMKNLKPEDTLTELLKG